MLSMVQWSMLGQKAREFKPLTLVSLVDLVPIENFYRQLEDRLDLRFIHELVSSFYSDIGRPSIDPVVFFKLQLIAFFEGIRSERQLMETVNLNLAHRWYVGYDLGELVPDHSSLSKTGNDTAWKSFTASSSTSWRCVSKQVLYGERSYISTARKCRLMLTCYDNSSLLLRSR